MATPATPAAAVLMNSLREFDRFDIGVSSVSQSSIKEYVQRAMRRGTGTILQILNPIFSSRYFLLIIAHSRGVRDLSGTLSSSTTAHPLNLTALNALKTPGRSPLTLPSSTNRYFLD